MDWIEFASKAIESLAWPSVALILGLVFRRKLLDLIPTIRKFKAGPLEAEFELATKQVLASAAQASSHTKPAEPPKLDVEPPNADAEFVAKLIGARTDPAGMILGGWSNVDGELFQLGLQLDMFADPLTRTTKVYEAVMSSDVLPDETRRLILKLRDLRNQVAHAEVTPTVYAAQDYLLAVARVVELIHNYRKNLPKYGPSNR